MIPNIYITLFYLPEDDLQRRPKIRSRDKLWLKQAKSSKIKKKKKKKKKKNSFCVELVTVCRSSDSFVFMKLVNSFLDSTYFRISSISRSRMWDLLVIKSWFSNYMRSLVRAYSLPHLQRSLSLFVDLAMYKLDLAVKWRHNTSIRVYLQVTL